MSTGMSAEGTEREELFALWQQYGGCSESDSSEGWELADAILAAGWRRGTESNPAATARVDLPLPQSKGNGVGRSRIILCEHECKIYGRCYDRAACNVAQRCVSNEPKEIEK